MEPTNLLHSFKRPEYTYTIQTSTITWTVKNMHSFTARSSGACCRWGSGWPPCGKTSAWSFLVGQPLELAERDIAPCPPCYSLKFVQFDRDVLFLYFGQTLCLLTEFTLYGAICARCLYHMIICLYHMIPNLHIHCIILPHFLSHMITSIANSSYYSH